MFHLRLILMNVGWQQLVTMIGAIAPVFILIALGRLSRERFIGETGFAEMTTPVLGLSGLAYRPHWRELPQLDRC